MEQKFLFKTKGTCSSEIEITVDGDTVTKVKYYGGCSGNTQGVARLAEGHKIDDIINLLSGIKCGFKSTSCPDQLAKALNVIKNETEPHEGIKQIS